MSNDRYDDKQVSEAYKSLAQEKTPGHLDRKVLEMAAAGVRRPGYLRWMAWSRPLAWAATITLCLAITLELTREPALKPTSALPEIMPEPAAQEAAPASLDANSLAERLEAPVEKDLDLLYELEPRRDVPEAMADSIVTEKTELRRSAAQQPASAPAPAARSRQTSEAPGEEKAKMIEEIIVADEQSFATMSNANVSGAAYAQVTNADDCTEEDRADAESWLECIVKLESAGKDAVAKTQRDALKETFPDFKLP